MSNLINAIVASGGNVELNDDRYSVDVIKSLLTTAATTGAQVTIHASAYPTDVLLDLARLGGGNLTVKFE